MSDRQGATKINDEVGCIGDYNPHDHLCCRKCSLALRCIVECNRRDRLEQFMGLLEFEDIGPADLQ
jgi:hypothetical protein